MISESTRDRQKVLCGKMLFSALWIVLTFRKDPSVPKVAISKAQCAITAQWNINLSTRGGFKNNIVSQEKLTIWGVWEIFRPFTQFFCDPETALKISLLKNLPI